MGLGLAFRCFYRALTDNRFAKQVEQLLDAPADTPDLKAAQAVQLLGLLQRDGRLLDFLHEDISGCTDDQIGAAVRDIHRHCAKVLERYVELEAVLDKPEESVVEVSVGFDPDKIRLTGTVKGHPPFRGVLVHRGWRAKVVKLPELAAAKDPLVLMPAEVEVS